MEINLPNNKAWKKGEPPTLSYIHDRKMKREMKRSSKRTFVRTVSRNHTENGKTIVLALTRFQVLSQSNHP